MLVSCLVLALVRWWVCCLLVGSLRLWMLGCCEMCVFGWALVSCFALVCLICAWFGGCATMLRLATISSCGLDYSSRLLFPALVCWCGLLFWGLLWLGLLFRICGFCVLGVFMV